MNIKIPDELIEQYTKMDEAQQQRLLAFARSLTKTPAIKGESGASIVQAIGLFDPDFLDDMEAAIRAGTEDIDWHGWE